MVSRDSGAGSGALWPKHVVWHDAPRLRIAPWTSRCAGIPKDDVNLGRLDKVETDFLLVLVDGQPKGRGESDGKDQPGVRGGSTASYSRDSPASPVQDWAFPESSGQEGWPAGWERLSIIQPDSLVNEGLSLFQPLPATMLDGIFGSTVVALPEGYLAGAKALKYGPGAAGYGVPGGLLPGGGAGMVQGVVGGTGGIPGTATGVGTYPGGVKPPKYGGPGGVPIPGTVTGIGTGVYPSGVKPPKYGTGTVLGTGVAPLPGPGTGGVPLPETGGYPGGVKPPKPGVPSTGITGTGISVPAATPGVGVLPDGTGLVVPGGTRLPEKPAKAPTLPPGGTIGPAGVQPGTLVKPPKTGAAGKCPIPYGGYGPYGVAPLGTGVLPGAKPITAPGVRYPTGVGLGPGGAGVKPAKPGAVAPGTYGGYPQAYPGGYVPGLTPQQAKAAKYGTLQGFLGGGYRGGAACQGKYCGRRRK
ncbi:hypothetical protein PGIGA_G00125160 [Pangasianodon gigas]|uniref:Uncharacterized protein n=1 Tax=Pangasianodon gigas TaxID=30993 RepID=A0ACC5XHC4_PANGG|nr:hypothetical protein [Pangasianodon gigas]